MDALQASVDAAKAAQRYRRKPYAVTAAGPITYENAAEIAEWVGGHERAAGIVQWSDDCAGTVTASVDDFIVDDPGGRGFIRLSAFQFAVNYDAEPVVG